MANNFVHLHAHTEFSLLDGMPKVDEYIIRLNELGQPGMAITEHGNMRSLYSFNSRSKGKFEFKGVEYQFDPIKPVFGIEFYVAPFGHTVRGMPDDEKEKIRMSCEPSEYRKKLRDAEKEMGYRARWHLLCFAKNQIGLRNLFKLQHISFRDGFYYRPRIDFDLLKQYSEGLVVTTACIGGYVPEKIIKGDWGNAEIWLKKMKKLFGDDLYVEIQPHNIADQKIVNLEIIRIANDYDIKAIATNDCHYLLKEDWESHNVLLAIQSNVPLQSADAWRFDDTEFYLKSEDEMYETFKRNHPDISLRDVKSAMGNTMEVFEKCNHIEFEVNRKKGILPKVVVPSKYTGEKEYLLALCRNGWTWRNIPDRASDYAKKNNITVGEAVDIYQDRLKFELKRIFKLKFEKYFLIIHDLISWARSVDIMVGPGRGSSAASLVCYLLGITSIDPVEYDLLFHRFLNENRIDYPDVDMDFEDTRRKEIFTYLFDKYGEENVCQIGTTGRMKGKAALKDVGRTKGVPHYETNIITKHIVERSSGDARASQTVEDSFNEFEVCKEYNKKYPDVLKFVKKLEGKARQVGIHAAGIQIADRPIDELTPIEYRESVDGSNKIRVKVSSFDWLECQGQGLVKLDVLGLKTLTVLKDALRKIKDNYGVEIDLEKVNLNEPDVLKGFTDGRFEGIFQFDSIGMTKTCEKLTFKSFGDIIALNALYRPGSMRSGLATHYINRSIGKEKIKKLHPIYDEITAETYGVLVYQEQLIKCFVDLAGYDPGTGDELRKKMAKSHGVETMGKEKDHFIDGAVKAGVSKEDAQELFENMAFFGSYAFNKAHAAAYGVIAYWGMYLKIYYPAEFYYSLIKNEKEQTEILRFVRTARNEKIEVGMPDINLSEVEFSLKGGKILSGLCDIKGCGNKASLEVVKNQPYTSLYDLYNRTNSRQVNRGVVKSLVKSGAFSSLFPNMKSLLAEVSIKNRQGNVHKKALWELMIETDEETGKKYYEKVNKKLGEYSEEELVSVMSEVCPIPPFKHPIEYYEEVDKYLPNIIKINEVVYNGENVCCKGILVDIKYNNVGDFHKEEPSLKEKKRISWGKRYANINIQDETGITRVNVDIKTFPAFRHIIDKGMFYPVAVYGKTLVDRDLIFCDILIDLNNFRKTINKYGKDGLGIFEKYVVENPVPKYRSLVQYKGIKTIDILDKKRVGEQVVIGTIVRVKYIWTKKKDHKMCFIDLEDETARVNVVVWPSILKMNFKRLKEGYIVRCKLEKTKTGVFIDEVYGIHLVKKYYNLEDFNE